MDLLQEYEKSQPKAQLHSTMQTQEQLLRQRYAPDTGFFVRLVMRLSGGRIESSRQASWVLLGITGAIFLISLLLILSSIKTNQPTTISPTNLTKLGGQR